MSDATTGNATGATGSTHPLDHVVWNALTGRQRRFALGDGRAWRFPAAIAPFAAIEDTGAASFDALRALVAAHGPAALVMPDEIELPAGLSAIRRATLLQMVWQGTPAPASEAGHVTLAEADVPDMLALTTAAQPGPFGPRTFELGRYATSASAAKAGWPRWLASGCRSTGIPRSAPCAWMPRSGGKGWRYV